MEGLHGSWQFGAGRAKCSCGTVAPFVQAASHGWRTTLCVAVAVVAFALWRRLVLTRPGCRVGGGPVEATSAVGRKQADIVGGRAEHAALLFAVLYIT